MFAVNRLKSDGDQKNNRNLNMIKLFYQNKDYSTAKTYVLDLLTRKPDSSEAYKLLSQINEALGENDEAMKNYKKSLDLKIYSEHNNSLDNSYQFTPTKISSPVITKNNNHIQENVNQISIDDIEKVIERKMVAFEKFFENTNHNITKLNETLNLNFQELSSFKKKFVDIQKKLTLLENKQDEFINKSKNQEILKEQLNSFAVNFNNLSEDNSKIIDELYNLKDTVKMLCNKSNMSDYDEESYHDYENEEEEFIPKQSNNIKGQNLPKLNELFKKPNDTWTCQACCTSNSNSETFCASCEALKPSAKPLTQINGNNANNDSKFSFGFGSQPVQSGTLFPPTNNTSTPSTMLNFLNPNASVTTANSFSFGNVANSIAGSVPSQTKPISFASNPNNSFLPFGNQATSGNSTNSTSTTFSPAFTAFSFSKAVNLVTTSNDSKTNFTFAPTISNPVFGNLATNLSTNNTTSTIFSAAIDSKNSPSVELVYTKNPKPEHIDTINKLKLPINFYDYEEHKDCKGCIGCKVEELNWNELTQSEKDKTDVGEVVKPDLGLFSSIATDMNVTQQKVDSIAGSENVENEVDNDQSFVSEKSKLLPQNFEIKTGEEGEEILFNERGKMYHYVSGEWKERGVGNMKILKQQNQNIFRLLMRRDRILNVICNHKISEHIKLEPFQNSNNTLTWFSKDFSEESSGIDEVFALKFKNEALMNQFKDQVNECISRSS